MKDKETEGFIKVEIVLNPCPWCNKTPSLWLPITEELTGGTWVWSIYCENNICSFKPKGRHVSIRKNQRFNLKKMLNKLGKLCAYWNQCEKYPPYEKTIIWLDEWDLFLKRNPIKIGSYCEVE